MLSVSRIDAQVQLVANLVFGLNLGFQSIPLVKQLILYINVYQVN